MADGADELGYLAFTISLVASAPQVLTSVLRRGAGRSAVSIPAWLLRGGAQLFWLYFGLVMHNGPIVVAGVVTIIGAAVVVGIELAALTGARRDRGPGNPPQADQQAGAIEVAVSAPSS